MAWYNKITGLFQKLNPAQETIRYQSGTNVSTDALATYKDAFIRLETVNRGTNLIVNACASLDYDIKDKVISGGTQRVLYMATLDGKQGSPFVTASLIVYHGWDVTMTKVTGTDRSFSWSIRKVG